MTVEEKTFVVLLIDFSLEVKQETSYGIFYVPIVLCWFPTALRLQNGSYITNGHHRLNRVGDYTAAGTTFTYRKREGTGCPGECVSAKGPVNQTIDVQVCSKVQVNQVIDVHVHMCSKD